MGVRYHFAKTMRSPSAELLVSESAVNGCAHTFSSRYQPSKVKSCFTGASGRLTLKKGRHILSGAVINGPGMSDFCVRFIDEEGNPVTNYNILNK